MASATAGPSSPRTSASSPTRTTAASPPRPTGASPTRTQHGASRTVQMYDSPLREGDSFASYGSAGRETDVDSSPKRGGDGDLGEIQTATYTKRRSASDRKGKGRAVESTYRPDDIRIPVEADEVTQDEEDEEAEAKRIEANLARWAKADSERRATLRRSSRLIQTTVVAPPPIPGASDLIRKTSTLLRTASQRRRTSGGAGRRTATGLTEEELELAAAGQIPLRNSHGPGVASDEPDAGPSSPTLASRREQRKLSLRLDSNVDLTSPTDPSLRSAGTARSDLALSQIDEELNGPDPFSPVVQQTLRQARGGSVFIENLPPLPQTPSAIEVSQNPFATPQTSPDKASTRDRRLTGGMAPLYPVPSASSSSSFAPRQSENPFIDVVVTSPSPAKYPASRTGSVPRSRPASTSQQSLVSMYPPPLSPSNAHEYPYGEQASMAYGYRPSSPAYSSSSNPASPLQGNGPRRRRSYEPRIDMAPTSRSGTRDRPDRSQDAETGWLSWLMCGCLRPENDDDGLEREVIEQRGRTNPNE